MALLQTELLDTKQYPASILRYMFQQAPAQAGVVNAGDYLVSQRAAGANMSIDIAAGGAWVQGGSTARQGLYHQVNDATVNQTVAPADATNPRVDTAILAGNDSNVVGISDTPQLSVVAGTPTAGATLDNRSGANSLAAYPSFLRVADVLVPAGSASVVNGNIRDRRPWARGAYWRTVRTSNGVGTDDYTTTSAVAVDIDQANLRPRIECSGAPLRMILRTGGANLTAGNSVRLGLGIDGVLQGGWPYHADQPVVGNIPGGYVFDQLPTPGSHLIGPQWMVPGGTGRLLARASAPFTVELTVEEIVRQNAGNNPAGYG